MSEKFTPLADYKSGESNYLHHYSDGGTIEAIALWGGTSIEGLDEQSEEVVAVAETAVKNILDRIDKYEKKLDEEMIQLTLEHLVRDLISIIKYFRVLPPFVSSPEFILRVKKAIVVIGNHFNGSESLALSLSKKFDLDPEFLSSVEFVDIVQRRLKESVQYGYVGILNDSELVNSMPHEYFSSPDFIAACKSGIVFDIGRGKIESALVLKNKFEIPEEFFLSNEFLDAVLSGLNWALEESDINKVKMIISKFELPGPKILENAQEYVISKLYFGNYEFVLELKDTINFNDDFFNSQEVYSAALMGFERILFSLYDVDDSDLTEDKIQNTLERAFQIKKSLNLKNEDTNRTIKFVIEEGVKEGYSEDYLDKIRSFFKTLTISH